MPRPDFDGLRDLHNCANDLLNSSVIQQALAQHRQEKWVNEVSEACVTMLDLCGTTKDVLLIVKDHLQSMFRRASFGEPGMNKKVAAYNLNRKKLKKELLRCLKGMKKKSSITIEHSPLAMVVNVLGEVRVTFICIVESLFSIMSLPWPDRKSANVSLASTFMRRSGKITCEEATFESRSNRLEDVEIEVDCIFRRLIQTRVSLLNIITN